MGVRLFLGEPKEFFDSEYLTLVAKYASGAAIGVEEKRQLALAHRDKCIAFGLGTPVAYAGSGSDIMQVVFDLSANFATRRGKKVPPGSFTVAYFALQYGASRFAGSGMNGFGFVNNATELQDFCLTSPHSKKVSPEEQDVINNEDKAIEQLRALCNERPIGAVVLENIAGAAGCLFIRPQFRLRLRQVCSELGILLIADETLMAFRTGYPYSFLADKEDLLQPDLVMIGKGFGVAALMAYRMSPEEARQYLLNPEDQLTIPPTMLARSIQTLKTLENNDMLRHVRDVAPAIHQALRDAQTLYDESPMVEGVGFAIGMHKIVGGSILQIKRASRYTGEHERVRLLLPLNITLDSVKNALK